MGIAEQQDKLAALAVEIILINKIRAKLMLKWKHFSLTDENGDAPESS